MNFVESSIVNRIKCYLINFTEMINSYDRVYTEKLANAGYYSVYRVYNN